MRATPPAHAPARQGIHNYLVYGGELAAKLQHLPGGAAAVHLISNEEGWIATVQSMPQVRAAVAAAAAGPLTLLLRPPPNAARAGQGGPRPQ